MRVAAFVLLAALAHGADLTVAADGSGDVRTVQAAVDRAPANSTKRFVIHIKPGTYRERVTVPREKPFLTFEGEDARTTIITFDLHAGLPGGPNGRELITFDTPTVFIQANDFTAEKITFANTAGNQGQALALTIMGDRGVFRDCRFLGYQDTLLAQAGRQYFQRCYIEGAVDFIFGGSTAFFDQCEIHVTANGYITAANTQPDQRYGYVFSRCKITGAAGVKTYLGRPWRPYAATVYLDTEMSDNVRPEGWNNWNDPQKEKTARYAEFGSTGPGAAGARVAWAKKLTADEARDYTTDRVLGGVDGWDPIKDTRRVALRIVPGKGSTARVNLVGIAADTDFVESHDGLTWKKRPGALPQRAAGTFPSLAYAQGTFHLIWESDKLVRHATSKDLSVWTESEPIDVMPGQVTPDQATKPQKALDVHSPRVFFYEATSQFYLTWSSTLAANAIQAFQEEVGENPRVWFSTTRDFKTFSPARLLFDNNYASTEAALVPLTGRIGLIHTDATFPVQGLRFAFANTITGPWGASWDALTPRATSDPSSLRVGNETWIYFARPGGNGLVRTKDFVGFTDFSSGLKIEGGSTLRSVVAR